MQQSSDIESWKLKFESGGKAGKWFFSFHRVRPFWHQVRNFLRGKEEGVW